MPYTSRTYRFFLLGLLGLLFMPATWAADLEGTHIPGYNFGYGSIEKGCYVKRDGKSLTVKCKESRLKPVSRSCEGQMVGGLDSVKLNCSGGLWSINQRCKIIMLGANKGEINCKL